MKKLILVLLVLFSAVAYPTVSIVPKVVSPFGSVSTNGATNLYVGDPAPSSITTGTNNTVMGIGSGGVFTTGGFNVCIGNGTCAADTTGHDNSAFGYQALNSLTTGSFNLGLGSTAISHITTGSNNIGIGANTGLNLTTGLHNTFIGVNSAGSGGAVITGSDNSGYGEGALYNIIGAANQNTGAGRQALVGVTSGSDNTGVGLNAGLTITTGIQNTFLGSGADATVATLTNAGAIGYNASVTTSNSLVLGNSSIKVGIGSIASPTAKLHLPAGTATANTEPLKINAGTNLSAPEAGAVENDGTYLYYTSSIPTRTAVGLRPDLWSGYHPNGCSWARTNTAYGDPASSSCTLTQRQNQNFGTVVTSGSTLPGITFTPTRITYYYVCAQSAATGGTLGANLAFKLWDGTTTIAERDFTVNVATDYDPVILCGIYNATSVSAVTLSIQTKASAGSVTLGNAGQAISSIEWSIFSL